MNTAADFSSRLEPNSNENSLLKIREDVLTQAIEVNLESAGRAWKIKFFFQTDDVELPSEKQLWQQKQEKCNAVYTEPPLITVSHRHKIDKSTNTSMHNLKPFNKIPRILFEQDANPLLLNFGRQMLGLLFDEQILATNTSNKSQIHSLLPKQKRYHNQKWHLAQTILQQRR